MFESIQYINRMVFVQCRAAPHCIHVFIEKPDVTTLCDQLLWASPCTAGQTDWPSRIQSWKSKQLNKHWCVRTVQVCWTPLNRSLARCSNSNLWCWNLNVALNSPHVPSTLSAKHFKPCSHFLNLNYQAHGNKTPKAKKHTNEFCLIYSIKHLW